MADISPNDRMWKVLGSIEVKLSAIEGKLESLIRLEERVNNHDEVIARYGGRLDVADGRIMKTELWQAEHNPDFILTNIKINQENIEIVKQDLAGIKKTGHVNSGRSDIAKEIFKWVSVVLAGIVVYMATRNP